MEGGVVDGSLEGLRTVNRARVVEVLRRRGKVSRAEIARETGLSRSTVSSLVGGLIGEGLVLERVGEADDHDPGRARASGRPPVLLAFDASAGLALGIAFGHSHVRVALADLSSEVLGERRREHDVDREALAGLDAAAEMARELLDEVGADRDRVIGAGMGLSGPIDHARGRTGTREILPGWFGIAAQAEMEARVGVPVRLENDANLGALAEAAFGAGRGSGHLVYLMLSSGIGAGLFLNGRLYRGVTGMAGEVGHLLVDESGPLCRCGNRGCLETFAAGPPLAELVSDSKGETVSIEAMLAMAADGDPGARRVLEDAGRIAGRSVAGLCNLLNPELVVVGGRLATAGDLLLDPLRESVRRHAIGAAAEAVRVRPGVLGERAEVLGALALVIHQSNPLFV